MLRYIYIFDSITSVNYLSTVVIHGWDRELTHQLPFTRPDTETKAHTLKRSNKTRLKQKKKLTLGSGWQHENGTPHFSTPGDEQLK